MDGNYVAIILYLSHVRRHAILHKQAGQEFHFI